MNIVLFNAGLLTLAFKSDLKKNLHELESVVTQNHGQTSKTHGKKLKQAGHYELFSL